MQSFIHRKNIELFKRRLSEASTDDERKAVEKLLKEELAKGVSPRGESEAKDQRRPSDSSPAHLNKR